MAKNCVAHIVHINDKKILQWTVIITVNNIAWYINNVLTVGLKSSDRIIARHCDAFK
jgi:hypothetical protein